MAAPKPNQKPRDPYDWYVEERFAVELLLDAVKFNGEICDPCCGLGTIPEVCRSRGLPYFASDLIDRGYKRGQAGIDFLKDPYPRRRNFVFNPPYGRATTARLFIERALSLADEKVAALCSARFLFSESRWPFFQNVGPTQILFLSSRPSCPPGELLVSGEMEQGGGAEDYVWLVWDLVNRRKRAPGWLVKPGAGERETARMFGGET